MKRIALVSEHASPLAAAGGDDSGGQNVYVASIAREFARRGLVVDVFTRRDNEVLPRVVTMAPGLRVVHLDAGPPRPIAKECLVEHMPAFAADLARAFAVAHPRYDVAHANFFMSAWATLRAARTGAIPVVTTFHALGRVRRMHQGAADGFPDCRLEMEDEAIKASDRIVAECPQDHSDLVGLYGADARRIDVVPCGVDAVQFSPLDRRAARRRLGWPEDRFVVLQLGRIVPRKGIDTLIDGIATMRYTHRRDALCVVVGGNAAHPHRRETPEIGRLADHATRTGVADLVSFVGRRERDALATWFSAADVFVTVPWYEPFGITPLEAMACGLPVVGSAVGGIRSTIVDGVTGFTVMPRDPAALATRLARLMDDEPLRVAMGAAGRERAITRFGWDTVADRLLDSYERAAARRRDAPAVDTEFILAA